MGKYIDFEYLKQNNPNPEGIQYKGLFGNRSIGKTHGVLKHIWKNRKEGEAFLILRRNKLELNFKPFVQKYSSAFDVEWTLDGNTITEEGEIIGYFSALSLAERSKNNNYDFPYITDIIVDEVFAEKPNKNEFQQLLLWVTTVSRRTGNPFHPVTVWLLGNFDYGYSPILEGLNIFSFNGVKQKTSDGVFLFSEMPSPRGVINSRNQLVREIDIRECNEPVITWNYQKQSFGLWDMGTHMYVAPVQSSTNVYDLNIKLTLYRLIMRKQSLPPVYVQNYDCLRFIDVPENRLS